MDLCFLTAAELVAMIRGKEVSAVEVMRAHLERIEAVNPALNAIVTLLPGQALAGAERADAALGRGDALGPLHGLPIAHKDLVQTKGVRTTLGSPIFADFVPERDELLVERCRDAGAILIGKTNTPEFGAGSQTFNPVFGATRNPYDTSKTCGGSSGGAAVALAAGMLPIADGSDMGGSLRNPATFCNVVGFRPSPGLVPVWPALNAWGNLSVSGPMARTVEDAALLLSAIAGYDRRSPIALQGSGERFRNGLDRSFAGARIAWSADLGGLPIDRRTAAVTAEQRVRFAELGCLVEDAEPDLTDADEIFQTLRAHAFASRVGRMIETERKRMKDTVIWNVERGLALSAQDLGRADRLRTLLYDRVCAFMENYEFLICPVSQVPPFDVDQPYVTEIEGTQLETYIDWMKSCWAITVTGLPAISVPAGFTEDGLPVGLQIVGRARDDLGVLQLAHAFEQITGTWRRRPPI